MTSGNNKDFEAFAGNYKNDEQEILVLIGDQSGAASKFHDSWAASRYFLAYVDVATNELKVGDGRINWLLSAEQLKNNGLDFPYQFGSGSIYRIKVKDLIDRTVPEGRLPAYYNCFMVVEVLERYVQHDSLLAVLAEYRTPVVITDDQLGRFELNKDYNFFEGVVNWLGRDISVSLEVDTGDKESLTAAMDILRVLYEQRIQRDHEFRTYAAGQLTDLANKWRKEEDKEITRSDFESRIRLTELVINDLGDFDAYYHDDNMFYRHAINVSGNIESGLRSANIEG